MIHAFTLYHIFSSQTSQPHFHYSLFFFFSSTDSTFATMFGAILNTYANPTLRFSCTSSNHNRPSYLPEKPAAVKMSTATATTTTTTTTTTLAPHSYWASLQADIEAYIKQSMPIKEPRVVFEPMDHLTFAAPRTTVPALCLAACELVGGHRRQAMAAASALLLLQAAYYTHEHLPLTDRPKTKTKPAIPHAYGPNIELLTGDGLVPFGFELLSRSDDQAEGNSERVLRVIVEISRAAGSEAAIDGYYRKAMVGGPESGGVGHVERIKGIIEKREGALGACAGACGAVLGGGSEEEIERLRKYGFYVGMVQGFLNEGLWKQVEEVKDLAFKELQFFKDEHLDAIESLLHIHTISTSIHA